MFIDNNRFKLNPFGFIDNGGKFIPNGSVLKYPNENIKKLVSFGAYDNEEY